MGPWLVGPREMRGVSRVLQRTQRSVDPFPLNWGWADPIGSALPSGEPRRARLHSTTLPEKYGVSPPLFLYQLSTRSRARLQSSIQGEGPYSPCKIASRRPGTSSRRSKNNPLTLIRDRRISNPTQRVPPTVNVFLAYIIAIFYYF